MMVEFNMGPCSVCAKPAELGQHKACVYCAEIHDRLCANSSSHACTQCGGPLDEVANVFPHNLCIAVKAGDLDAVRYLDGKSQSSINDVRDKNGRTLLELAVGIKGERGIQMANLLVSLGVSIHSTDSAGRTALMHAVRGRKLTVALGELFRASVDCRDGDGKTALMFAAVGQSSTNGRAGSLSTAKLLVSVGADLSILSKTERTALGYAIKSNDNGTNEAMVQYLEAEMLQQEALAVFMRQYQYAFDGKGVLKYSRDWHGHDEAAR